MSPFSFFSLFSLGERISFILQLSMETAAEAVEGDKWLAVREANQMASAETESFTVRRPEWEVMNFP